MIRILICDDQAIIREGLEMLLRLEADFQVVGLAADGREAVELAARHQPDLVLMDLKMPGMNGVEATRRIRTEFPNIKVLVLTTYHADEWVFDALRAGASGYLLKDLPRQDVIAAARGTVAGKAYLDPSIAGQVMEYVTRQPALPSSILTDQLTQREIEILRLLAQGLTNAEIGDRLALSEGTVRNHISAILSKLDLKDRTQAAILAIQHGLNR